MLCTARVGLDLSTLPYFTICIARRSCLNVHVCLRSVNNFYSRCRRFRRAPKYEALTLTREFQTRCAVLSGYVAMPSIPRRVTRRIDDRQNLVSLPAAHARPFFLFVAHCVYPLLWCIAGGESLVIPLGAASRVDDLSSPGDEPVLIECTCYPLLVGDVGARAVH